jgi:hypothetical protein
MDQIIDYLHIVRKRILTNSSEKFYIQVYSETKTNNQINEESTTGFNKIYDVEIQHENDSYRP